MLPRNSCPQCSAHNSPSFFGYEHRVIQEMNVWNFATNIIDGILLILDCAMIERVLLDTSFIVVFMIAGNDKDLFEITRDAIQQIEISIFVRSPDISQQRQIWCFGL